MDCIWINNIISQYPSPVLIRLRYHDYVIDWTQIVTGGKAVKFINYGAATINGVPFSSFWYRDVASGGTPNMPPLAGGSTIVSKYQSIGNYTSAGDGKAYGYYFDLQSDGTSSEPIRGVIGNVACNGVGGSYKAVRVGAVDNGTADALMAFCGSVTPNATTLNAYITQLSDHGYVDDVTTAILIDGYSRYKNGIEFLHGLEVDDAWIQASMGAGSGENARFIKLKDTAGNEMFAVLKDGSVRTSTKILAGSEPNGTQVSIDSIRRTHGSGNLTAECGANGELFFRRGTSTIAKINSDNELEITTGKLRLGTTLVTEADFQ